MSDVTDPSLDSARPVRADARRNRQLLVDTARREFLANAGAPVSLEGIAKAAGVGIGTLYRHFPTREALVEAVYRTELDEVTTQAGELLAQHRPDVALRLWLDRYAEFVAAKTGIIETLRAGWASGAIQAPTTRERVNAVLAAFMDAGAQAGVLRDDLEADDVTALLLGVFLGSTNAANAEQATRLLDLFVDALRPPAQD